MQEKQCGSSLFDYGVGEAVGFERALGVEGNTMFP